VDSSGRIKAKVGRRPHEPKRRGNQRRDRQVLLVKDLDDETLEAIRTAQPLERSRELGLLLEDLGTG
jgi:hypothetical protein